ncbi:heavy-metal-associated domain-containing protein [Brucella intermedia]|uniref:Heavy metal transport/detoxification protein n=1 Tax=Brucella intermedia M86 TaxID=1234597 RepID=M5JSW7_9HYPH|nr:heavy-metal-associated domain-containing protein [Brucella intermedia]ELT51233.1 heavy metal transport/detoxification protein [Brucella intermedia M86]
MLRFNVPNMTCGGCAKSVKKALESVDPTALVDTFPEKREVVVEKTTASEAEIRAVLEEAGYPATSVAA